MTRSGVAVVVPEDGELSSTVVQDLTTETSTTTLLASGESEPNAGTAPDNYLDGTGECAAIDTTLVEPTANSDSPKIPAATAPSAA